MHPKIWIIHLLVFPKKRISIFFPCTCVVFLSCLKLLTGVVFTKLYSTLQSINARKEEIRAKQGMGKEKVKKEIIKEPNK